MSKLHLMGAVCPYSGNTCPGPERCAPALIIAHRANEDHNKVEGADLMVEPVCPIVDQLEVLKYSMGSLMVAFLGEPEPAAPPETAYSDRERKIAALVKLGIPREEIE